MWIVTYQFQTDVVVKIAINPGRFGRVITPLRGTAMDNVGYKQRIYLFNDDTRRSLSLPA